MVFPVSTGRTHPMLLVSLLLLTRGLALKLVGGLGRSLGRDALRSGGNEVGGALHGCMCRAVALVVETGPECASSTCKTSFEAGDLAKFFWEILPSVFFEVWKLSTTFK